MKMIPAAAQEQRQVRRQGQDVLRPRLADQHPPDRVARVVRSQRLSEPHRAVQELAASLDVRAQAEPAPEQPIRDGVAAEPSLQGARPANVEMRDRPAQMIHQVATHEVRRVPEAARDLMVGGEEKPRVLDPAGTQDDAAGRQLDDRAVGRRDLNALYPVTRLIHVDRDRRSRR
jgi:hypothetical protein